MIEDKTRIYREWAVDLSPSEQRLRISVLDRLPPTVIDCHGHSSPMEAINGLSAYAWGQPRSSFPSWEAEDHAEMAEFLYGNRTVTRCVMAHPYKGFDHRMANEYLLRTTQAPERVILCGLPDDPNYTVGQLQSGQFCALKMYPAYREPPYDRIDDFFPAWSMEAAAAAGVPVVLHVARPLHKCVDEVRMLAERYPDVPIILAHLGRMTIGGPETRAAFEAVAALPQVVADTSMAVNRDVHTEALKALGPHRVLFGSDEPFNLLRYVQFRHPSLGMRLMAPRRYHWLSEGMYRDYHDLARDAVIVHLQVLRAIIDTVDAHYAENGKNVLGHIFHDNAATLFRI